MQDDDFYAQINAISSPRTLTIKMRRTVDANTFTSALHEALAPRMELHNSQNKVCIYLYYACLCFCCCFIVCFLFRTHALI